MFLIFSTVPVNRATRELSESLDLAQVLQAIQLNSVSQINFTHFFIAFEPQRTLSLHNLLNKHWNICSSMMRNTSQLIFSLLAKDSISSCFFSRLCLHSATQREKQVRDRCAALQIPARIAVFPKITRRNTVRSTVVKGKKGTKGPHIQQGFLYYNFTRLILFLFYELF